MLLDITIARSESHVSEGKAAELSPTYYRVEPEPEKRLREALSRAQILVAEAMLAYARRRLRA